MANGYYPPGYFTYHAEGSSSPATDKLHWPSNSSGVTIGPGYDLKNRTESEVYADMISIGVAREDAKIIKKGTGKKFHEADAFVKKYKNEIKPLSKAQKIALFTLIWKRYYVPTAKRIYDKLPSKYTKKILLLLTKEILN